MTVRKKLQKLGSSRALLIDRDLLAVLLPDGNLDATLLVEAVSGALVVRREGTPEPSVEDVQQAGITAPPELPGFSPTERRVLDALRSGAATRGELAERVQRAPETVSAALKTLKGQGLVVSTGRDWRLTPTAKWRLEPDEGRKFAGLPPSLARLVIALEAGPLTARQVAERLGVPRRTANALLARAMRDGVVTVTEDVAPLYALRVSPT